MAKRNEFAFNTFVAACYTKWIGSKYKYQALMLCIKYPHFLCNEEARSIAILRLTEFIYEVNIPDCQAQAQASINRILTSAES